MFPGFYNFWSPEFWVFVGQPWVPTAVGAGLPLCQKWQFSSGFSRLCIILLLCQLDPEQSCFSHSHLNWVVFIGGAKSVTLTVSGTWWDNTGKLSNSQSWAQRKWKNHCFLYHLKLRSDPKPAVFVQSTRQYLASDVGSSASCIPGVIIATTDF